MRYKEYKLNKHVWVFQNSWLTVFPTILVYSSMTIQFEWLFWQICIYNEEEL